MIGLIVLWVFFAGLVYHLAGKLFDHANGDT